MLGVREGRKGERGGVGGGGSKWWGGLQENAIFIIYLGIFGVFFLKKSSNVLINI